MDKDSIRPILQSLLQAAETELEKDKQQDEQLKKVVQFIISFLLREGLIAADQLAEKGKTYVKQQVQKVIEVTAHKASSAISFIVGMILGFLIVGVGLLFGAVSFSLFIGELIGSNALGFLIAGILWVVLMLFGFKKFFNKKRLEEKLLYKLSFEDQLNSKTM